VTLFSGFRLVGHLWRPISFFGASWVHLGASWGHLGAILGPLGAILGPLGASWGHLGAIFGPLGSILGPLVLHNPRPGGMREAIKVTNCYQKLQTATKINKQ